MSYFDEIKIKNLSAYGPVLGNRWFQIFTAVIAMIMIANLQYSWTLFTNPLIIHLKSSLAVIQYAFTLFIMFETFIQPFGGYLLDRFNSKLVFIIAGLLIGFGWTMIGQSNSVVGLYVYYSIAGVGAAIIYGGCISIAIRWFPDRRGLALGIIASAFALGSIPFIPVIDKILQTSGFVQAFRFTGIFQGIVIIIIALILRYPIDSRMLYKKETVTKLDQSKIGFSPIEMLKAPYFWLLWSMFFAISVGGLIITANAKPFGNILGISASYIVLAVILNNLANGTGRVFWGMVSDKLDRPKTMFVSFGLNAVFLFILPFVGSGSNVLYVICLMLIMFTWGQLFSLFPSINTDVFGSTYASSNYGFLYSAKGFAAILGGGFGAFLASTFTWNTVFSIAAIFSLYASIMSLILPKIAKPVR